MKKFNFKNKREYLNKQRSSDAASRLSKSQREHPRLESNWKNYEEDVTLQERGLTDELNFNELLESSSMLCVLYLNNYSKPVGFLCLQSKITQYLAVFCWFLLNIYFVTNLNFSDTFMT